MRLLEQHRTNRSGGRQRSALVTVGRLAAMAAVGALVYALPIVHAPAASAATSAKKGVSTWDFPGIAAAIKDVGASWYYNWSPSNDSMPADAEFVPMIWDETYATDATLAKAREEGSTLLGFNEPDMDGQARMRVDEALNLWPRLQNTGMRLGSPAVA